MAGMPRVAVELHFGPGFSAPAPVNAQSLLATKRRRSENGRVTIQNA